MPKIIKNVTDMEIDEISLVDRGANQHALVTIAKRASTEEDHMPEIDLYDEEGTPFEGELEHGDVVYDVEGNAYEYQEEQDEDVKTEEKQPELVGKRANPFDRQTPQTPVKKSYSAQVLEELSKAYSDEDRDAVLSKAFDRVEELEKRQAQAEEIAKSERDLRLTREYISKAAEYNLPVNAEDLGPVLYRMADTMSYEDCSVIAKCLESAGALIFDEVGVMGGGDNTDVMSKVSAFAMEEIGKADSGVITDIFDNNPDAYNEYLAQRG